MKWKEKFEQKKLLKGAKMFDKVMSFFRQKVREEEAQKRDVQIKKGKPDESLDFNVLAREMDKVKQKEDSAAKILDLLEIPYDTSGFTGVRVDGVALVELLMNEEKFKKLSSKLRLKAFW